MPYKDPERQKEFQRNWRKKKRRWLQEYKSKLKCEKCGFSHVGALVFHHIEGNEKEYTITKLVARNRSIKRIMEEIKKCQVLCANCHSILHYEKNK